MRKQIRIVVRVLVIAGIGLALAGCEAEPVSQSRSASADRAMSSVSRVPAYGGNTGVSNGE